MQSDRKRQLCMCIYIYSNLSPDFQYNSRLFYGTTTYTPFRRKGMHQIVLKCLNNDKNANVLVVILVILDMIFTIVGVQFGIVRQLCEECAS